MSNRAYVGYKSRAQAASLQRTYIEFFLTIDITSAGTLIFMLLFLVNSLEFSGTEAINFQSLS